MLCKVNQTAVEEKAHFQQDVTKTMLTVWYQYFKVKALKSAAGHFEFVAVTQSFYEVTLEHTLSVIKIKTLRLRQHKSIYETCTSFSIYTENCVTPADAERPFLQSFTVKINITGAGIHLNLSIILHRVLFGIFV